MSQPHSTLRIRLLRWSVPILAAPLAGCNWVVMNPSGDIALQQRDLILISTALMLLIVGDVIGRNLLDLPITGVSEIAARTVVAIVFLQVPAAILQRRLTRADFLLRRIGQSSTSAVALLEILFCLTGAVVFALIVWASWPKFASAWTTSEFFGVQGVWTIPTWPFRAITVLGAAMATLAALYRVSRELAAMTAAQ